MVERPRWEQPGYSDIVEARVVDGGLEVHFADGDVAWMPGSAVGLDPVSPQAPVEIEAGLAVRVGRGDQANEVSWTAIRSATDAEFAQHLRDLDAEESRRLGLRLRALREDRGMNQAELARLARMAAPQLARIERGGLDMRVSTVRTLLRAMGANFSDIAGPDAPEVPVRRLVKRATDAGVPREVATVLAQAVPRSAVASVFARAFNWSRDALLAGVPKTPRLPVAVQFKTRPGKQPRKSPMIQLAFTAAQLVRSAFELPPYREVPADPFVVRREVAVNGRIALPALLEWAWNRGVPVLPLIAGKDFSAAVWAIKEEPVIVISDSRQLAVFWLFDLAHEIGHIALGHVKNGLVDVDSPYPTAEADADERSANDFALKLLLGDPDTLLAAVKADARGDYMRFKFSVQRVAEAAGVSPGVLGMVAAYALPEIGEAKDRWGSATNLARSEGIGREQVQEVAQQHLHLGDLPDLDATLVRSAVLGETA